MTAQFFSFIGACLAIIVVPGPDLMLLLRNAAAAGRRLAAATALGIMVGNSVLAVAAVAGLTALFQGSELLYDAVRLLGAAYLVYLGIRSLAAFARRGGPVRPEYQDGGRATALPDSAQVRRGRAFREGLVSNLLNPKVAAFYLALFPQFTLPGVPTLVQHGILAGVFCALALGWYVVVLALLARIQDWLRRRRVQRGISGIAGSALIFLGMTLALQGRA